MFILISIQTFLDGYCFRIHTGVGTDVALSFGEGNARA